MVWLTVGVEETGLHPCMTVINKMKKMVDRFIPRNPVGFDLARSVQHSRTEIAPAYNFHYIPASSFHFMRKKTEAGASVFFIYAIASQRMLSAMSTKASFVALVG